MKRLCYREVKNLNGGGSNLFWLNRIIDANYRLLYSETDGYINYTRDAIYFIDSLIVSSFRDFKF